MREGNRHLEAGQQRRGCRARRGHSLRRRCPDARGTRGHRPVEEAFADLKIRFVNVVDLFKLQPASEHPHGLSDRDFDTLFTRDKPVIFNFHGYPWLIHRLAYRRTNHENMHVRGYKERGNINTPLELAINNQIDRFSLAIDVIDRVPGCKSQARTPRRNFATSRSSAVTTPTSTASTSRRSSNGAGR